jgi:hypothetical protein
MLRLVPAQHLFFQRLSPTQLVETRVRQGRAETSQTRIPSAYLAPPGELSAKLARRFGKALRVFAHALWLSPLLIVPKFLLNFVDVLVSDGLLVLFVTVVVGFFASLAGLVLMRLIGGARDELSADLLPPARAAALLPNARSLPSAKSAAELQSLVGKPIVVRGSLEGGESAAQPALLHDLWLGDDASAERVAWSAAWTVEAEDVTIISDLDAAPHVIGPTRSVSAQEWFGKLWTSARLDATARWHTPDAEAELCTLHSGDSVELRGVVARVYDGEVVPEQSGGYRRSGMQRRPIVVLASSVDQPLQLRALPDKP